MLGNSQIPEDMKISSLPDDDVGLRNESRFTTTIYSETGEVKIHASNQSRFWYIKLFRKLVPHSLNYLAWQFGKIGKQ